MTMQLAHRNPAITPPRGNSASAPTILHSVRPLCGILGSVSATVLAVQRGAHLLRVHDVAATRDALTVLAAEQRREGRP
jgi:dihydropteroate synthase